MCWAMADVRCDRLPVGSARTTARTKAGCTLIVRGSPGRDNSVVSSRLRQTRHAEGTLPRWQGAGALASYGTITCIMPPCSSSLAPARDDQTVIGQADLPVGAGESGRGDGELPPELGLALWALRRHDGAKWRGDVS
jgi:hypothetical protein